MKKSQKGFTLPLMVILGVVLSIFALTMARSLRSSSRQMVYFNNINRSFRLAETGLNDIMGQLATNPDPTSLSGIPVTIDNEGTYENDVEPVSNPFTGSFYIVTSATREVSGKIYATKLHTYARISNVSDFFAAVSDDLALSAGVNAGLGKVYSPKITFWTEPGKTTYVERAEYVNSCEAMVGGLPIEPPWDGSIVPGLIDISTPTDKQPVQLTTPLQFPQISESDIAVYKTQAGPHTNKNVFTGHIFPPGYQTAGCVPDVQDTYPDHTCDNTHHIYYSTSDIRLEGIIHGQVLFVSEKDIYISSSLVSMSWSVAPPSLAEFPGDGFVSSSTAHQAILITRGNIVIDNTFYTGGPNPVSSSTQTIHAIMFCPNGSLITNSYGDDSIHDKLNLSFTGSMILGNLPLTPPSLPSVFGENRTYNYMDTLRSNPPPYLPIIAEVFHSFEEVAHTN